MTFAYPWTLLGVIPLALIYWRLFQQKKAKGLAYSDISLWASKPPGLQRVYLALIPSCRFLAILFLIIAGARPQSVEQITKKSSEGLDILLTIDTSGSMNEGIPYRSQVVTRLEAAKAVVAEFVAQRPQDRIGLVVFGEEAFTQAPLTLDHQALTQFIDSIYINMAGKGTSIGPAIATSVKRLRGLEVKSKIVILLTDGRDSGRDIDPLTAAKAATTLGVKIYTVGIGGNAQGGFFGSLMGRSGSALDENTLTKIAQLTGGKYFRADSVEALSEVYSTIDKLEKSEVEVQDFSRYHEEAEIFLLLALLAFCCEMILGFSPWRVIG